jgi:hypothetical protein
MSDTVERKWSQNMRPFSFLSTPLCLLVRPISEAAAHAAAGAAAAAAAGAAGAAAAVSAVVFLSRVFLLPSMTI